MEIVLTVVIVLAVIGAVAAWLFRTEMRRETRPPRHRSRHDDAYGKNVPFTGPAADAEIKMGGRGRRGRHGLDTGDFGGGSGDGGGGDGGD